MVCSHKGFSWWTTFYSRVNLVNINANIYIYIYIFIINYVAIFLLHLGK